MLKKTKLKRHYWKAELKKWKWNPNCNSIDAYYEEYEKDFTTEELKNHLKSEKLYIALCTLLSTGVGCLGFISSWILGLILIGTFGLLTFGVGISIYCINHYKSDYSYFLGYEDMDRDPELEKTFADEINQNRIEKEEQEKLAEKWRKKHPLEEKVRLALTMNPNYVADLLRYCELVKPNKNTEKQRIKREAEQKRIEEDLKAIKVKYLGDDNNE